MAVSSKKILVTGASGFIGSRLVPALVAAGHKVKTFGRFSNPAPVFAGLPIEHFGGDVVNPEAVNSAVAGCDVVYHLAGLVSYRNTDRERLYGTNVTGTRNVMDASLKHKVS